MLTKHSFLTFCLLALIFSEINCQIYRPHSLSSDAMSALTKPIEVTERFKRDIDHYCVGGCSLNLRSNINSYFPRLNDMMRESENSASYTSTFTQLEFETFCKKIFSPLEQCLSTCSVSQTLSILEYAMSPLKYLCNDVFHEFYNSVPCRNSVINESISTCLYAACEERKVATDFYNCLPPSDLPPRNSVRNETVSSCLNDACKDRKDTPRRFREATRNRRGLNYLLAENCRLVSCVASCETQYLKRVCGANVAKLTKDYLKIYSSSMDKMDKIYPQPWSRIYQSYRECTICLLMNIIKKNIKYREYDRISWMLISDTHSLHLLSNVGSNKFNFNFFSIVLYFFCFNLVMFYYVYL